VIQVYGVCDGDVCQMADFRGASGPSWRTGPEEQLYSAPRGTCTAELAQTLGRGQAGSSVALCVGWLTGRKLLFSASCCNARVVGREDKNVKSNKEKIRTS
jgi:hypothetical protein